MIREIDKKLIRILLSFYSVYFLINILQRVYLKSNGYGYRHISWSQLLVENTAIEIINTIPLMLLIIYFSRWMIKQNFNLFNLIIIHALVSVVTGILFSFFYVFLQFLAGNISYELTLNSLFTSSVRYLSTHFLIYFTSVFIINTYFYLEKSLNVEIQKINIEKQLAQVKVNILKYQLHPHFFFNTLNSISSLIDIDTKLAQNTLADFSDFLRDILFLKDSNLLPISVEMKVLKRYIGIMGIRFSDHLNVSINLEEDLDDALIPSLILQPILENGIKHGYSYDATDLKIDIDIFKKDSQLYIEVINNGEPLSENYKYGTGLKNTIERLKTLYGDNYTFSIENRKNRAGVKTKMIIPFSQEQV
ncbi:sensor histidine kinase [Hanstruepera flava]|uniref:sensor histidine kinase n=1 Tax=Hanstruepera flava TaxID=2930218 RepID=UPI002029233E|nr:histidine kinase [Hanstruepera flava]